MVKNMVAFFIDYENVYCEHHHDIYTGVLSLLWVNYNISRTWNKASHGDDSPYEPSFLQGCSEVDMVLSLSLHRHSLPGLFFLYVYMIMGIVPIIVFLIIVIIIIIIITIIVFLCLWWW